MHESIHKRFGRSLLLMLVVVGSTRADDAGRELFESRIRPALVEHCYQCHNSRDKAEGGLALDSREALLEGGDSGLALVPGKPESSLILKAIRHARGAPKMPKAGIKMSDGLTADFARWIKLGAFDPRDAAPDAKELQALTSWESTRDRRKASSWSLQPLTRPAPPAVQNKSWSDQPIDQFLLSRMEQNGLAPAAPADRPTLIRRVSFALNGLPPTPEEIARFVNDPSPRAYEELVDRLLASPRFGERWARHWMDWFRYADSHGSEGDPAIPYAWRYRDYLIRALNADVPYDRLIREALAGDLLPDPRVDRDHQINESALGVGHFRMVPHGYAPTQPLDEQVTFTDNQIDVVTKGFLGLTVSCARCHNHKFDAIGQTDFYALYGVMASARPALITVDTPERLQQHRDELLVLKVRIKAALASAWTRSLSDLPARLARADLPALTKQISLASPTKPRAPLRWNLAGVDFANWFRHGNGLLDHPSRPGEFRVLPGGDRVVANVYPAGVYTHLLSDKNNGVFTSPRFKIDTEMLSIRAAGGQGARARIVVQNYPRAIGGIYPTFEPNREDLGWYRWDLRYWKGEWAHIEIATGGDLPVEFKPGDGRSWFGISEVVFHDSQWTPPTPSPLPADFVSRAPDLLARSISAFATDTLSDDQAILLGAFVRAGLVPNTLETLPEVASLVADYRAIEARFPVPTRAPGLLEGTVFDQPMFVRGEITKPGEPIPRRSLEVFKSTPYPSRQSGRLELATETVDPVRNPLTPRVIVNRLWHHLFGRGIVATPDNFGALGESPTHPELLDALATQFIDGGWSIKQSIRQIVLSKAYQQASLPSALVAERDPNNHWLSHFPVRRLEAEAVRDAILAVSGRLDDTLYGPDVSGRTRRRSVYVRVQRNDLDPFLNAFDAPEPLSARGRRDTTNVPAQSLTLLNDPWVSEQTLAWGEALAGDALPDDDARIRRMFMTALGRMPAGAEVDLCRQFLADSDRRREADRRELDRLAKEIETSQNRLNALTTPARDRLLAAVKTAPRDKPPEPMANWELDGDLRDTTGSLHGEAVGNARVEGGALVLDGASHVQTPLLPRSLTEKTLEAWVMLDRSDQRGAGVMSVETVDGGVFDAIVFAEQRPDEWLAGSNNFERTRPFEGSAETEATRRPVHLAIVYRGDGMIIGYRDGVAYGKGYLAKKPPVFGAGQSRVVFGLRHSPAGGNKMLVGKILRARLYDRALDAREVAASAGVHSNDVSDADVLAALPEAERAECARLAHEIAGLRARKQALETPELRTDFARRWQELAHAMINFKEFIYTR